MSEQKVIYAIGHRNPDTDSICSAIGFANLKRALGMTNVEATRAGEPNKETKFALEHFGVQAPQLVSEISGGQEVILVDHNELGQAVKGIEGGKIIEIVDHHRFGGLETSEPITITVRPVGCTGTIVTGMYQQHGIEIPKQIAGLLMSAIISDTVLFKSPTCTEADKAAVKYLAGVCGEDYEKYGIAMLKAGADIGDMTPAQIVKNDSKEFQFGEYHALVAQLSVMDTDQVLAMKDEILAEMTKVCQEENFALSLVMVTDIIKEGTYLLFSGEPKALIAKAFNQDAKDGVMYLPGVMSRKKQIIPPLSEAVKSL